MSSNLRMDLLNTYSALKGERMEGCSSEFIAWSVAVDCLSHFQDEKEIEVLETEIKYLKRRKEKGAVCPA